MQILSSVSWLLSTKDSKLKAQMQLKSVLTTRRSEIPDKQSRTIEYFAEMAGWDRLL